jgi:hypothetical protein
VCYCSTGDVSIMIASEVMCVVHVAWGYEADTEFGWKT